MATATKNAAPHGAEAEAAFTRVFEQRARLNAARERVTRERDRLDASIAETVSADPGSRVWYASPGVLTIDQAATAAGETQLGVDRAMERHRTATTNGGPRRRRAKGAKR